MRIVSILLIGNIETQVIFYIIYSVVLLVPLFALQYGLIYPGATGSCICSVRFLKDNRKCQNNSFDFSLDGKVLLFNKFAQEMTDTAEKM